MAKEQNPKPNPVLTDLSLVESSSRAYRVNGRRSLASTERILRRDPRTSVELDRTGGLGSLLTRTGNNRQERHYLSLFVNFQTSLFIDRVTGGDILRTPSFETLFEQARENTNISVSISTSLDSCCAEIQGKLDDLSNLIRDGFRRLRVLIIRRASQLEDQASALLTTLTDSLTSGLSLINNKAEENYKALVDLLLDNRQVLLTLLNQRFGILEEIINQTKTFILNAINTRYALIETQLKNNLLDLKNYIKDSFEVLLASIESSLLTQRGLIVTSLIYYYESQVLPVLAGVATGVSELVGVTTYISTAVG